MTKLDWSKAKPKPAPTPRNTRKSAMLRQTALVDFVARHDLACFRCGTREGMWAKTGVSGRGPWAICVSCVRA